MSAMIGRLLRRVHAGEHRLLWHDERLAAQAPEIEISSDGFSPGGPLPQRFAGNGVGLNLSPPLSWRGVPALTKELVLALEDPDAPLPRPFLHLMLFGISPSRTSLPEGQLTGRFGLNTFRRRDYAGPRALPGHGPHRYVFQLFALGRALDAATVHTRADFLKAAAGNVLARGRLEAIFERR